MAALEDLADIHPATAALLKYFSYEHLPPHLQEISRPFHDLAHEMVRKLPKIAEVTVGVRKLLEAKDAFVRAALG